VAWKLPKLVNIKSFSKYEEELSRSKDDADAVSKPAEQKQTQNQNKDETKEEVIGSDFLRSFMKPKSKKPQPVKKTKLG